MSDDKETTGGSEFKASGELAAKGIQITEQSSVDALLQRGYGTAENKVFTLAFYEALYLLDKKMLEVKGEKGKEMDSKAFSDATKKLTGTLGLTI